MKILTVELPFTADELKNLSKEDAVDKLYNAANDVLTRRSQRIVDITWPVIKEWYETREHRGKIIVPITDGKRVYQLRIDIVEAYNTQCRSIVKEWHKFYMLLSIDELWKEHLRELDQLRQSVQNASYEQKDPLVIYKVESFHLFEEMLNNLNVKALSTLFRGQIFVQQPPAENPENKVRQPEVKQAAPDLPNDYSRYRASKEGAPEQDAQRAAASAHQGQPQKTMPAKAQPRVGRNDPCPCGSGKKFKNCHGKNMM